MRTVEKVDLVEKIEYGVKCNVCRKTISRKDVVDNNYLHIEYLGGENSLFPGRYKKLQIDICESCMESRFSDIAEIEEW